jgi:hypothetical protein
MGENETVECWGRPPETHPNVEMRVKDEREEWTDYVCPHCQGFVRVRG